jgi:hypothetical protein
MGGGGGVKITVNWKLRVLASFSIPKFLCTIHDRRGVVEKRRFFYFLEQ